MKSIWRTISSTKMYKGKWFNLKHDEVILPNGKKGEYDYINKKDFVLIIPRYNSLFYLVKQFRYPVKKTLIEFPQGTLNDNELPLNAVMRETKEELGLYPKKINLLGRLDLAKGCSNQGMYVYYANKFEKAKQKLDATEEDITIMQKSQEELERMIKNGDITDGPTISAYTLYLLNNI
jgi:8-oxo-dGTP pyrophosphatase MutT (NUDIX family)